MSKESHRKRPYRSKRRHEQANQTRRQVAEAARRLFIAHGYTGATIEAIAQEAQVAAETIYATFGNKRSILTYLVQISVLGDDAPFPLLERPEIVAALREPDQRAQITLFAGQMSTIMSRMAPLSELMRAAAKTEAEIAALRQTVLRERRQGMSVFVRGLAANGPLRAGLSLEEATERVFALSSGEMFTVLTVDLGWAPERYERWLAETLSAMLLPEKAAEP